MPFDYIHGYKARLRHAGALLLFTKEPKSSRGRKLFRVDLSRFHAA